MRRLLIVVTLSAAVCAGCGSGSSGRTPGPSSSGGPAAAMAQIKQNWVAFFNYATSATQRASYLEDGSTLLPAIAVGDKFAKQQKLQETATVQKVTIVDATHATVDYTISSRGSSVFSGNGNAILQDGSWKVAKPTFCTLIQLAGKPVPGC